MWLIRIVSLPNEHQFHDLYETCRCLVESQHSQVRGDVCDEDTIYPLLNGILNSRLEDGALSPDLDNPPKFELDLLGGALVSSGGGIGNDLAWSVRGGWGSSAQCRSSGRNAQD